MWYMTPVDAAPPRRSPARAAMIDAAERIVAEHGLAALTLRGVQQAAGQSNKSAANYHFGSRDGLIAAILDDRMRPIHAHRRALLDRLDAHEHPHGYRNPEDSADDPGRRLRALAEALVVPLARRVLTVPGSTYARFLAQSMVSPELAGMITQQSTMFTVAEVQRRIVDALNSPGAPAAGLDAATARWRTDGLLGHTIGALAAAESTDDPVDGARLTARLVDTCYGILTATAGRPRIDLTADIPIADADRGG